MISRAVLPAPQDEPPPGSSTIGELPSSPEVAKSGAAPPSHAHFFGGPRRTLDGRDLHRQLNAPLADRHGLGLHQPEGLGVAVLGALFCAGG